MLKKKEKLSVIFVSLIILSFLIGCETLQGVYGNPENDKIIAQTTNGCDWIDPLEAPDEAIAALDLAINALGHEDSAGIIEFKRRIEIQDSLWLANCSE